MTTLNLCGIVYLQPYRHQSDNSLAYQPMLIAFMLVGIHASNQEARQALRSTPTSTCSSAACTRSSRPTRHHVRAHVILSVPIPLAVAAATASLRKAFQRERDGAQVRVQPRAGRGARPPDPAGDAASRGSALTRRSPGASARRPRLRRVPPVRIGPEPLPVAPAAHATPAARVASPVRPPADASGDGEGAGLPGADRPPSGTPPPAESTPADGGGKSSGGGPRLVGGPSRRSVRRCWSSTARRRRRHRARSSRRRRRATASPAARGAAAHARGGAAHAAHLLAGVAQLLSQTSVGVVERIRQWEDEPLVSLDEVRAARGGCTGGRRTGDRPRGEAGGGGRTWG